MSSLLGFATTQAEPAAATVNQAANLNSMASMLGGLILVLIIIFLLAYVVKRLKLVPASHGVIKTLAYTPVGQREKVVLVELGGQQYLLGVTAQQINLIDKLDNPIAVDNDASFADRLRQASSKQQ